MGLPRRPRDDGAAYAPSARRWRPITAPGFAPALLRPSGVWLGSALVVVGQPCDDQSGPDDDTEHCEPGGLAVGVYEPERDRWRIVPPPPTRPSRSVGTSSVNARPARQWSPWEATSSGCSIPSPSTGPRCHASGDRPVLRRPREHHRHRRPTAEPASRDQDPSASASDDTPQAGPASEPPTHLWSATLPAEGDDWTPPAPIPTAPVCAEGTAYIPAPTPLRLDPVDNTLVPLPPPPIALGTAPVVTTADDRVVFWPDDRSAVSFTPSTQQWRITEHGNGRRPDAAIWIGEEQFLLVNEEAPGYTAHLRRETLPTVGS